MGLGGGGGSVWWTLGVYFATSFFYGLGFLGFLVAKSTLGVHGTGGICLGIFMLVARYFPRETETETCAPKTSQAFCCPFQLASNWLGLMIWRWWLHMGIS